ncbi:MAG TPA: hypothetical protein VLE73_02580 [Candidatus Saccharimonadales bacterium]|nr:hypothetical protein [Candidatus Saccharimonadales bacterium]
MHSKPNLQAYLTRYIRIGILVGIAIWSLLLALTVAKVMGHHAASTHNLTLGPLKLATFTSSIQADSSTIFTIALKPGVLAYLSICAAFGASIGYLMHAKRSIHKL